MYIDLITMNCLYYCLLLTWSTLGALLSKALFLQNWLLQIVNVQVEIFFMQYLLHHSYRSKVMLLRFSQKFFMKTTSQYIRYILSCEHPLISYIEAVKGLPYMKLYVTLACSTSTFKSLLTKAVFGMCLLCHF